MLRKTLTISVVLLATAALASPPSSFTESGVALTGTAPSAITEGINLQDVLAVRVIAVAPSGQTITGGYLDCYYWPNALARWTPCITPSITLRTGSREAPSYDYQYLVGMGRLRWVPRSITLSGAGTTVSVVYEVAKK